MKKDCSSCMGQDIKDAIKQVYPGTPGIDSIPTCDNSQAVIVCGVLQQKEKGKRKPSAYNEHIKTCFVAHNAHGFSPETMKICAKEWTQKHPK